jgi:hypothetical protein
MESHSVKNNRLFFVAFLFYSSPPVPAKAGALAPLPQKAISLPQLLMTHLRSTTRILQLH